jgi:hypothetical protein
MIVFTANQLIAHAIGDYILQSDWMANNKTKRFLPSISHALTYAIPFYFLTNASFNALLIIVVTHFAIDSHRLARYIVFAKNFLAPRSQWPEWENCKNTGYPDDRPPYLTVWLLIIADNILHIFINAIAIQFYS